MSRTSRISVRFFLFVDYHIQPLPPDCIGMASKLSKPLSHLRYAPAAKPPLRCVLHASITLFRLYTHASYIERASYTYKSVQFNGVDFDIDEDADYDDDDDDDDDDECDFGSV